MRVCTKCREAKDESQFSKHRKGPGGLQWHCKACCAAYQKQHSAKNPNRQRNINAAVKRWESRNRDKVQAKDDRKNLLAHGLTPERYDEILAAQGGCCAVCEATENQGKRRFSVDHDHSCCPGATSCGKCVRGLLCTRCNAGLGMLQDNVDILMSAASYLLEHEAKKDVQRNGETHAPARSG